MVSEIYGEKNLYKAHTRRFIIRCAKRNGLETLAKAYALYAFIAEGESNRFEIIYSFKLNCVLWLYAHLIRDISSFIYSLNTSGIFQFKHTMNDQSIHLGELGICNHVPV